MAAEDDEFWIDLLAHVHDRALVPITGPALNIVSADGACRTLTELIAERLVRRYGLDVPRDRMTMGEAAAAFVRERRDERDRLYPIVSGIIAEVEDQRCAPLRTLAEITDLSLFVSTTPDRLLANALNDVRFDGRGGTREVTFSPSQATGELASGLSASADSDTTVVRLFGRAASTPQYAVHDEDVLEWLYELLSEKGSLPEWITYALKHRPLLFVGCDIPDWLGRFLLRLSSSTRISMVRKQFFVVGTSTSAEPRLADYFSTYGGRARVRQLRMEPVEFVGELRRRWQGQRVKESEQGAAVVPRSRTTSTIFISYLHEDIQYARRLADKIKAIGGDVWFDERSLTPGVKWEAEILDAIRNPKPIQLFLPVISRNTEQETERFVFREWHEAAERSHGILDGAFIIPVVIDVPRKDQSAYGRFPADFRKYQFGYAPEGAPDADLEGTLREQIKAMRRREAR